MDGRFGLGPVFASEWRVGSRSPRVYAIRAGFVLTLLAVLAVVWSGSTTKTLHDFAELGAEFYLGLVGAQITLILLAAPAATAGAICLEKSRGSLTHLLVTDLSDPEIVLGKLAARLVPTMSLVLCALPVQYFASFLGGIDPIALMGSTVVSLGVAVFACTLALTFSVWGRKTQEVLTATYVVLLVWLLAYPTALGFNLGANWPWALDPFQLAMAPYTEPGSVGWLDYVIFSGVMLGASSLLIALSIWRFRRVAAQGDRPSRRKARREWRWTRRFRPTLDGDPILWREWHRARPSRWTRAIWWIYYVLVAVFGIGSVYQNVNGPPPSDEIVLFVVGFGSSIGLLLLSVESATSLAEERARGSLDILMTTPLTTWSIVWGKWRGAYQRVFSLAIIPTLATLICIHDDEYERWTGGAIVLGLMLAYGAAITSLGLALATWITRLGRAVALSVAIYMVVTAGLFFVIYADLLPPTWETAPAIGSPFFGPLSPLNDSGMAGDNRTHWLATPAWVLFYTVVAASLLWATVATFDRCLGRARVGGQASKSRLRKAIRLREPGGLATQPAQS